MKDEKKESFDDYQRQVDFILNISVAWMIFLMFATCVGLGAAIYFAFQFLQKL